MTTYSFKSIGDTIYNSMKEIKENEKRIGAVYNHDIKIENGINLPAIIITPSSGNVNYLDSCNHQEIINFTVRLIDRVQKDIASVEDNMRVVADIMLSKLKAMSDIAWSYNDGYTVKCEFMYRWGFADTQEPFRVFEVDCVFTAIN